MLLTLHGHAICTAQRKIRQARDEAPCLIEQGQINLLAVGCRPALLDVAPQPAWPRGREAFHRFDAKGQIRVRLGCRQQAARHPQRRIEQNWM